MSKNISIKAKFLILSIATIVLISIIIAIDSIYSLKSFSSEQPLYSLYLNLMFFMSVFSPTITSINEGPSVTFLIRAGWKEPSTLNEANPCENTGKKAMTESSETIIFFILI